MVVHDVFHLYKKEDSTVPYVDLECNGVMTPFLVDTGAFESSICPEHLEEIGIPDEEILRVAGTSSVMLDVKL